MAPVDTGNDYAGGAEPGDSHGMRLRIPGTVHLTLVCAPGFVLPSSRAASCSRHEHLRDDRDSCLFGDHHPGHRCPGAFLDVVLDPPGQASMLN